MKYAAGVLASLIALLPTAASAQTTSTANPRPTADERIQRLVASISEERLQSIVVKLASFGTRETLSDTSSPTRGIGAARQWIFDEFKLSSPKLQVSFDTYQIAQQGPIPRAVELRNVIAILPGRTDRRIYITGHYDSVNPGPGVSAAVSAAFASAAPGARDAELAAALARINPNADAPGADDDASGVALTMELARVFANSGINFDVTLVFACWAGEEQGLIGSSAHAQKLAAEKAVVEAMLSNDIVGGIRGGDGVVDAASVRVYSAGPDDSMSLAGSLHPVGRRSVRAFASRAPDGT